MTVDRRLAEPRDEVEVVGREVLDDADVLDAVGERAAALGADEKDLADLALLGAPPQLDQRRVEALDVPDRRPDCSRTAQRDDLLALLHRPRQRLLDQQVHAGGGELARGAEVLVGRHRDDREVRPLHRQQRVDRSEHASGVVDRAVAVAERIDRAGEADRRRRLQQARVMAAHHPQADDRAAQRLRWVEGAHASNLM